MGRCRNNAKIMTPFQGCMPAQVNLNPRALPWAGLSPPFQGIQKLICAQDILAETNALSICVRLCTTAQNFPFRFCSFFAFAMAMQVFGQEPRTNVLQPGFSRQRRAAYWFADNNKF